MSSLISKLLWWRNSEQEHAEEAFLAGFHGILENEQQRKRMSPSALAVRLSSCDKDSPAYILLAHELSRRIAKIQALPTYVGVVSGLVGVVLGAWLNSYFQQVPVVNCVYPASTTKGAENEALNRPAPQTTNAVPEEPVKAFSSTKPAPKNAASKDHN